MVHKESIIFNVSYKLKKYLILINKLIIEIRKRLSIENYIKNKKLYYSFGETKNKILKPPILLKRRE